MRGIETEIRSKDCSPATFGEIMRMVSCVMQQAAVWTNLGAGKACRRNWRSWPEGLCHLRRHFCCWPAAGIPLPCAILCSWVHWLPYSAEVQRIGPQALACMFYLSYFLGSYTHQQVIWMCLNCLSSWLVHCQCLARSCSCPSLEASYSWQQLPAEPLAFPYPLRLSSVQVIWCDFPIRAWCCQRVLWSRWALAPRGGLFERGHWQWLGSHPVHDIPWLQTQTDCRQLPESPLFVCHCAEIMIGISKKLRHGIHMSCYRHWTCIDPWPRVGRRGFKPTLPRLICKKKGMKAVR